MAMEKIDIETTDEAAVLRAEILALRASVDAMTTVMLKQTGGEPKHGFDWASDQLDEFRRLWDGVNALLEERSPDAARDLVQKHPLSSLFAAFSLGLAFSNLFGKSRH